MIDRELLEAIGFTRVEEEDADCELWCYGSFFSVHYDCPKVSPKGWISCQNLPSLQGIRGDITDIETFFKYFLRSFQREIQETTHITFAKIIPDHLRP